MGELTGVAIGKPTDVLRQALSVAGMKQIDLAEKLDIAQASVSGNMNRSRIGMDVFVRMISVMGYDVAIYRQDRGEIHAFVESNKSMKEVISDALAASGMKKMGLAKKMNVTPAAISGHFSRPKVGADVFVNLMNAMGYKVLVGKKAGNDFKSLWELEPRE